MELVIFFSMVGFIVILYWLNKIYNQIKKRNILLKYPPGQGKIKTKDVYWSRNPARARRDDIIIKVLLDDNGINYSFARCVSEKLISSDQNNGWGAKWVYTVEYWD